MKEFAKSKTASKTITSDPNKIQKVILETLGQVSKVVGSTLGPNGKIVLIERQENIGPYVTKDGITVFNSMAFADPTKQAILEAARDSSAKTNTEAGDGPQPLYSKVLTPNGFVAMGELKVGMDVCGTDGTIQKVVGVFPKGTKQVYEVEIENKGVVECCEDHLWTVSYGESSTATKPLKELAKDYVKTSGKNKRYKYYIPQTHVEFNENTQAMPLDPYLLGVLIGDGSLRDSGSIELSIGLKKKHILEKLVLPEGIFANVSLVPSKNYYRVKIVGQTPEGRSIRSLLVDLGLANTSSFTKFIPKSYLYSSAKSRKALLQGLIDTDGHINTRGLFEFSTVSESLSADVKELCNGLGIPTLMRKQSRSKASGAYSDTTSIRITQLRGYDKGDKIVRITPTTRYTEMQCIKVSNPNSLYITDNYSVTHNTTSASILAEALIRLGLNYLRENPRVSTQKVMRELEQAYNDFVLPFIQENSIKITTDNDTDLLKKVALVATNYDNEMSDSVIECFNQVGHSGNVTIAEAAGVSGFEVEKVEGFHIAKGFEETCGRFIEEFINDRGNYRTILERPKFLLYNGKINDISQIMRVLEIFGDASDSTKYGKNAISPNLVIVAHHFSESVLAILAANFKNPTSINVLPLKTPMTLQANSPYHFLLDLSAFVGATVFDPLSKPLDNAEIQDLGLDSMSLFEFGRFKSTVIGRPEEIFLMPRVEELQHQHKNAESSLDAELLNERIAILTGGIARIKVLGSSEAELKEKRHRVEDAVAAIKGAIKYGVLPGCAKTLLTLSKLISNNEDLPRSVRHIMGKAFAEPFRRILDNGGYHIDEIKEVAAKLSSQDFFFTYDALNQKYGDAVELGILDSAAAVNMAIKNSLSVSKMLMGLSGVIVFTRDLELERQEARDHYSEQRAMKEALDNQDRDLWQPE
jgi:chaperonin GroEL (HSP60 family)